MRQQEWHPLFLHIICFFLWIFIGIFAQYKSFQVWFFRRNLPRLLAAFLSLQPSSGSASPSSGALPGSNFRFLGIGFENSRPASSAAWSSSETSEAGSLFSLYNFVNLFPTVFPAFFFVSLESFCNWTHSLSAGSSCFLGAPTTWLHSKNQKTHRANMLHLSWKQRGIHMFSSLPSLWPPKAQAHFFAISRYPLLHMPSSGTAPAL